MEVWAITHAVRVSHASLIGVPHDQNVALKVCDNTDHGGVQDDINCVSFTCPGDRDELCGASAALVLYTLV